MQKIKILGTGLLLMAFAACGNNQSTSGTAAATSTPDTTATAAAAQTPNSFTVEANDQMQFDVTTMTAKAGTPITIILKDVGTAPKLAMGHDLVVLKQGTDVNAFDQAAQQAQATDYIPGGAQGANIVAHTKLLGPGESDTITFTLQPGTYDYLCSFPGHAATMKGKLTVQ